MMKALLIVVAVAGLVAAGVFEGLRTNRWGASEEVSTTAARLANVPNVAGGWKGIKDRTMDDSVLRVTEAVGYVDRIYVNEKTRDAVDVLILCGPSGPIGAHTPDVCYAGSGYVMAEPRPVRRTMTVNGSPVSFFSAKFAKPRSTTDPALLVCWAWGVDGDWSASESPRREFMLRPTLNKLYVTRRIPPNERDPKSGKALAAVQGFLADFLPAVKTALAPPS